MKCCRGMTLLEVMVALAIFAMTATAILKAVADNLNNLSQLKEQTFANWVADNRLTEIQLENQWPPKNNQRGSEDMAGQTWYWQQKVEETADKDLRQVSVEVRLQQDSAQSITTVTTFVANTKGKS